jgi:hypothetical protein
MNKKQTQTLEYLITYLNNFEIEINNSNVSKNDIHKTLLFLLRKEYINYRTRKKFKFTTSEAREIIRNLQTHITEYVLTYS